MHNVPAKQPDPPPSVTLVAKQRGVLHAVRHQWLYRFMLDNGTTLDVIADRDDSEVRRAVLTHTKAAKIEGVARLSL